MSNQHSCGCGYNYRRSTQKEPVRQSRPAMSCSRSGIQDQRQYPLAMAYVPMQMWSQPLSPCKGLQLGTIFADLNKPFCGKGGAWK